MRTVTLISDSATPCGVESFQRRLAAHLASRTSATHHTTCAIVGQPGESRVLARALGEADTLVVGLPMVAWKRRLVAPARAMAVARRLGKAVVLVLHEWGDLDWKRRATYLAYLPLATRLLFSSPHVQTQFEADPAQRLATGNRGLVPIPPNLARPAQVPATAISQVLAVHRASGRLIVGHFGSIYARKQSLDVLDVVAALTAQGCDAHALFIGSFIKDGTGVQAAFEARVTALGLTDRVTVTGYIGPDAEVFAALEAADVFVYRFAEGLTSRRGSVLTCLQTQRPVVVDAPANRGEFDHHPSYRSALAAGQLVLIPPHASAAEVAEHVLSATASALEHAAVTFEDAWSDVAAVFDGATMPRQAATPMSQRGP
jgi:glycosyltransferase involved in cell wall biosynthesis